MSEHKRNYGIELLRLLSMFYVVLLHTLGHGGILDAAKKVGGGTYNITWFVEVWAYCAVDIFALISGFIGYESKKKDIKLYKLLVLWVTVLCYSVLGVLVCRAFGTKPIGLRELVKSCFPLTNGLYWYFNAYVGAFLFFPLINIALEKISDKMVTKLMVLLGIVIPVFEILTKQYKLMNGYSPIWLIILYLVGASANKLELQKKISKKLFVIVAAISIIVTWLWKIYGIKYKSDICEITISKDSLVSYLSPTILIVSLCYLLLFSQLKIDNRIMQKIAYIGGGSSFAIYLLNDNRFIRAGFLKDSFVGWAADNPMVILVKLLGFAVVFCIAAIIIDRIRICIFALLKKYILNPAAALVKKNTKTNENKKKVG